MSEDKLKTEPKVLPQRLMSFRGSRDLSLGTVTGGKNCVGIPNNREKPRKLFTPNVNVQRKKNQEVVVKREFSKHNENKNARGARGRGQGRGRHTATLVQASGSVFSEGIAVAASVSRRAKYDTTDRVKDEVLQIPKLNLKLNCKVDKEEEDRKLKELLRDDFVDDSDLAPDSAFAPVSLPLNNYIKVEQDTKLNIDFKSKVKEEKEMIIDGVKIKQEVVEKTETETEAESNVNQELGRTCIKKEPQHSENYDNLFLHSSLASNEKQLILIQFPDRLPALSVESPDDMERPNSSNVKPKLGHAATNQEGGNEGNKYCHISDLTPGHIGHLQIRKSGKIELVLGKCVLNVSSGTNVGFRQDLIAVQLHSGNQCTGETVELGPVVPRLICTPDWNTVLKNGGSM